MGVLFVFILSMMFTSFVKSDKIPSVMCAYIGVTAKNGYTLKVSEVPPYCEAVVYGQNLFNLDPEPGDADAIAALVAANKIAWTSYSYDYGNVDWKGIMTSTDPCALDQHIAPMIKYLSKSKLNGVILSYMELLAGDIPKYDTKIALLISKMKAAAPSLKIGLLVSGAMANDYKNKKLFDFSVTNPIVDLYVIDTSVIKVDCAKDTTATGGRIRIHSADKKVVPLETVCKGSSTSPMDQNKVLLYLMDMATMVVGDAEALGPYSAYCKRGSSELWCGDTMQLFYDQITFAKQYFKGIMIAYLDYDDTDNTCGCGKFSVANTFVDGWQSKQLKCCDKI